MRTRVRAFGVLVDANLCEAPGCGRLFLDSPNPSRRTCSPACSRRLYQARRPPQ